MGTFYGGIAHAPVSALILVSELAGSYDLLVPSMLASGIAFVLLRRHSLYQAQPATRQDSPVYRTAALPQPTRVVRVQEVMRPTGAFVCFKLRTPIAEIIERLGEESWQGIYPVVDLEERLKGIIPAEALRYLGKARDLAWTIAADVMHPAVFVRADDNLRRATTLMIDHRLRELPVVDTDGKVIAFIDEHEAAKGYLDATAPPQPPAP
jgi:CIC family chloride channel protein